MGCYKTHLRVTVRDMAAASGRCEETVRRHIKKGILNAGDLGAIHKWLLRYGKAEETEVGPG